MNILKKQFLLFCFCLFMIGCGFQLRGEYVIPPELKILKILPDDPYEPLQRVLTFHLKTAQIEVIEACLDPDNNVSVLTIISSSLAERATAYGPDVLLNRAFLQFTMCYHITDKNGKVLIPVSTIQVERELPVIPNAVLGTDFERKRVRNELYVDAAAQLLRQISVANYANSR